jgi:hypothetical protein
VSLVPLLYKEILSAIAIVLTFVAFYPYIRSIMRDETKPHVFSWVIWGTTTFVAFLAQLDGGRGVYCAYGNDSLSKKNVGTMS